MINVIEGKALGSGLFLLLCIGGKNLSMTFTAVGPSFDVSIGKTAREDSSALWNCVSVCK